MERCQAIVKGTGRRCRRRAAADDELCAQHRALASGGKEIAAAGEHAAGLYDECLDAADRAALDRATAAGLDHETALLRVLIRRALIEGKPATQIAYLVDCLTRLLKTRHVLAGKSAKQLDEALAAALDAVAAELGVKL